MRQLLKDQDDPVEDLPKQQGQDGLPQPHHHLLRGDRGGLGAHHWDRGEAQVCICVVVLHIGGVIFYLASIRKHFLLV